MFFLIKISIMFAKIIFKQFFNKYFFETSCLKMYFFKLILECLFFK